MDRPPFFNDEVTMEELVGKIWHRLVTRQTGNNHEAAQVDLVEISQPLSIYYRALGGIKQIAPAEPRSMAIERTLMQRVAGSGRKYMLSWQDDQSVYLPTSIGYFPEQELNEGLYFWLTALSTRLTVVRNWVADNSRASASLLRDYSGLRSSYRQLVDATVDDGNAVFQSGSSEHKGKLKIIDLLRNPERVRKSPAIDEGRVFIPLWLYPPLAQGVSVAAGSDPEAGDSNADNVIRMPGVQKKATRVDDRRETDGLLVFQLESLFSWSEQVQLDRCQEDGLDEDTASAAQDISVITLSRERRASGAKIRFDLDLPSPQHDDLPIGEGIKLPEWDYKKRALKDEYCLLQPMLSDMSDPSALPGYLDHLAQRLIPQFHALQLARRWKKRQPFGDDIDLDSWLDAVSEPVKSPECHAYYKVKTVQERDLACLLLADLSLSTETVISDGLRVIDVIRDTLLLFAETISQTKDRLGIYGFSSVRNTHIRYNLLKNFSEQYSAQTRGRIMAIRPGYYTRLGAAIRQSCKVLIEQATERRLLLIISDGKPNDIDQYEGRYGIEDTRYAVIEAKQQGITPFCITVDVDANTYLPYLFGDKGYTVVQDATRLPLVLPKLYVQLTNYYQH